MEKVTYNYIQMNTSTHLLNASDHIAIQIRRKAKPIKMEDRCDYIFDLSYSQLERHTEFIGLNLIFINLLAAVLEGTLRTCICEIMQIDSEKLGELSNSKKNDPEYNAIVRSYAIAKKYSEDVEFKGGWDNLKKQYREYFQINLDKVLDKEKTSGINAIFTLRNVAAHGTAIVTPKVKLKDASEGEYTFKWQSKLQGLSVNIQQEFNMDLLDALQHPSLSFYFVNLVKELINSLGSNDKMPTNSKALLNNLKNYSFGHLNNFEFPSGKEN